MAKAFSISENRLSLHVPVIILKKNLKERRIVQRRRIRSRRVVETTPQPWKNLNADTRVRIRKRTSKNTSGLNRLSRLL